MRTTLAKLAYKLSKSVKKIQVIRDPEFRKICGISMGHHSLCMTSEGVFLKI